MNEAEPNPNMETKCPQCGAPLPSGVLAGLCPACLFKQGAAADPAADAMPFQPPGVDEVARLFPQLEIIALIGKGGMGAKTQAACKEYGCVYLHAIGGAAQVLADCVKRVRNVYFKEEFGSPEAIWELEVADFPAVVTIDAHGNSLHEEIFAKSQAALATRL